MKNIIIGFLIVALLGIGVYVWQAQKDAPKDPVPQNLADKPGTKGAASAQSVGQQIVGKWQSNDDAKFVREFKADGTASDFYDGKVASFDTWKTFTKEKPVDTFIPLEDGASYLEIVTEEGKSLIFAIAKLTTERLDLVYMDREGQLSFTRIN